MTLAPDRPIRLSGWATIAPPTPTESAVCRRGGCNSPAGPDGLCPSHSAFQAALRASLASRFDTSPTPPQTAVRFVAEVKAARVGGWRAQAVCRGRVEMMHPDGRGTKHQVDFSAALALCATCPVVGPCREAGAAEHYGVWGGTTPADRFPKRRRKNPAA